MVDLHAASHGLGPPNTGSFNWHAATHLGDQEVSQQSGSFFMSGSLLLGRSDWLLLSLRCLSEDVG